MSSVFDFQNHYWLVTDSSPGTQVFSSAAEDFVPLANAAYVAWLAADGGNTPTTIPTAAELWSLLNLYANGAWSNSGFSALSTSVDLTLTNPLKLLTIINETGASKKLILPCMRSPRAPPIGVPFSIKNSDSSTNSFTLYKQDGSTSVRVLIPGERVNCILTDNSTKNGTLELDPPSTANILSGWTLVTGFTVDATTGSITTVDGNRKIHYKQIGKFVHLTGFLTITTNGTGAGTLRVTLPVAAIADTAGGVGHTGSGTRIDATTVSNLRVFIGNTTSGQEIYLKLQKEDGTYPGADNTNLFFSITYETP